MVSANNDIIIPKLVTNTNLYITKEVYTNEQTSTFEILYKKNNDTEFRKYAMKQYKLIKPFLNEVSVLERIVAAKIANCTDWFESHDLIYGSKRDSEIVLSFKNVIIMPWFENTCYNFVTIKNFKKYILNLINAVKCLHSIGIYHIDIKPENYLVNEDTDSYKLIDFSHSIDINDVNHKSNCYGTSYYVAPEVKFSRFNTNIDKKNQIIYEKVDVWSIGMTCLTVLNQTRFNLNVGGNCIDTNDSSNRNGISNLLYGTEFFNWFDLKRELSEIGYKIDIDLTYNVLCILYHSNVYGICDNLISFLNSSLQINPVRRICIDEMLTHPFITNQSLKNESLNYYSVRQFFVQEKAFKLSKINILHSKSERTNDLKWASMLEMLNYIGYNLDVVYSEKISDTSLNVIDGAKLKGFPHVCSVPGVFKNCIINCAIDLFFGSDGRFYVSQAIFTKFLVMCCNNKNIINVN